jgi:hypothetical protein
MENRGVGGSSDRATRSGARRPRIRSKTFGAPLPWRRQLAALDAGAGALGLSLGLQVVRPVLAVIQRPALASDPLAQILTADIADSQDRHCSQMFSALCSPAWTPGSTMISSSPSARRSWMPATRRPSDADRRGAKVTMKTWSKPARRHGDRRGVTTQRLPDLPQATGATTQHAQAPVEAWHPNGMIQLPRGQAPFV